MLLTTELAHRPWLTSELVCQLQLTSELVHWPRLTAELVRWPFTPYFLRQGLPLRQEPLLGLGWRPGKPQASPCFSFPRTGLHHHAQLKCCIFYCKFYVCGVLSVCLCVQHMLAWCLQRLQMAAEAQSWSHRWPCADVC